MPKELGANVLTDNSIIRNNAFIVHKENIKKDAKSHKEFTLDMINALMLDARKNFIPYNKDEKKPSRDTSSYSQKESCTSNQHVSKSHRIPRSFLADHIEIQFPN